MDTGYYKSRGLVFGKVCEFVSFVGSRRFVRYVWWVFEVIVVLGRGLVYGLYRGGGGIGCIFGYGSR